MREAGPPLASADPEPTKRPVPTWVSVSFPMNAELATSRRTNRATDCDHLQMARLELHRQRWLGGWLILQRPALIVCGLCDNAGIGIAFEALEAEGGEKAVMVWSDAAPAKLLLFVISDWRVIPIGFVLWFAVVPGSLLYVVSQR